MVCSSLSVHVVSAFSSSFSGRTAIQDQALVLGVGTRRFVGECGVTGWSLETGVGGLWGPAKACYIAYDCGWSHLPAGLRTYSAGASFWSIQ